MGMGTETLVSVDEYLSTSYDPDREYVDGVLLERNVGEYDHSRLQFMLAMALYRLEKTLGINVIIEQRVQVRPTRFRVPDICVLRARPEGGIVTAPPFLCIEILSPEDRMSQMQQRVDDYLAMGVEYVWVVEPGTFRAYIYTSKGIELVKDGIVRTANPDIVINLPEVLQ